MSDNIFEELSNLSEKEIAQAIQFIHNLKQSPKKQEGGHKRKQNRRNNKNSPEKLQLEKHRQKRRDGRGKRGNSSRVEPVDVSGSRQNRFLEEGWDNLERDIYDYDEQAQRDRQISNLIHKNKLQVSKRRESSTIEVECNSCGKSFNVARKIVFFLDGEYQFTCNKCQTRR